VVVVRPVAVLGQSFVKQDSKWFVKSDWVLEAEWDHSLGRA